MSCKRIILIILFSTIYYLAVSQTIRGVIKDKAGLPIPGATVMIKNSNIGVVADENGTWQLKAQTGKVVLIFSMLGYSSIERKFLYFATIY